MKYRIIADSSSDILSIDNMIDKDNEREVDFRAVPLKIITAQKEYVDDERLDVDRMIDELEDYKGRSSSSCPSVQDWEDAFGDEENIFCVTITSGLSGSYNTALTAANEYMEQHPGRKVFVLDTLSTGPQSALIIRKLCELISEGCEFAEIVDSIRLYQKHTHLVFALESLHNLACNGRVSVVSAKLAGLLGIRIVGIASEIGTLEVVGKVKGFKRALSAIIENMKQNGYAGRSVIIHHCSNLDGAKAIKDILLQLYPRAKVEIDRVRGLCAFYAEKGGILIGYEDGCLA